MIPAQKLQSEHEDGIISIKKLRSLNRYMNDMVLLTAGDRISYNLHGGELDTDVLLLDNEQIVQRWEISAGSKFRTDVHEQHEWLLVARGRCVVHMAGQEYPLERFCFVYIPPGTEHSLYVLQDAVITAIKMPPGEELVSGGR